MKLYKSGTGILSWPLAKRLPALHENLVGIHIKLITITWRESVTSSSRNDVPREHYLIGMTVDVGIIP